jgi:cellulose synthase/poly-beta-1,6-N-acetylglucosamine synthase-like glycosyltransferase
MKKLLRVTIGIPMYNEAQNIESLISSIFLQRSDIWQLDKLILYADGCTDDTVKNISRINNKKILLINSTKRNGQAFGQNKIINKTTSDVLVLLNADIRLEGQNFISNLVRPFLTDPKLGLTSASVVPLESKNYFEQVINWSHQIKQSVYESRTDLEIYLCHGRARAFSRQYYQNLVFQKFIAEDAYSYLKCKELNLNFMYCKDAIVRFRSPSNLKEYLLQSRRYFKGANELQSYFIMRGQKTIYDLSLSTQFKYWLNSLLAHPFLTVCYLFLVIYSSLTQRLQNHQTTYIWEPSTSSKKL